MEPVRATLPKLNPSGLEHITSPVRRTWDLRLSIASLQFFPVRFQFRTVLDDGTLLRCPRGQATAARPRLKIALRFRGRQLRDLAGDAYLPFLVRPVKH